MAEHENAGFQLDKKSLKKAGGILLSGLVAGGAIHWGDNTFFEPERKAEAITAAINSGQIDVTVLVNGHRRSPTQGLNIYINPRYRVRDSLAIEFKVKDPSFPLQGTCVVEVNQNAINALQGAVIESENRRANGFHTPARAMSERDFRDWLCQGPQNFRIRHSFSTHSEPSALAMNTPIHADIPDENIRLSMGLHHDGKIKGAPQIGVVLKG